MARKRQCRVIRVIFPQDDHTTNDETQTEPRQSKTAKKKTNMTNRSKKTINKSMVYQKKGRHHIRSTQIC